MSTKNNNSGLKNPIAVAAATSFLESDTGKKTVSQSVNAAKVLIITAGLFFAGKFAYSKFKEIRARRFADDNIGHPDLIAATIIAESFTRIGFPSSSILSYVLPKIDISTDEETLYEIASKITDIKSVANAYKIINDRNLQEDLTNGLANAEAQKFWKILNSSSQNEDTNMYGVGLTLYSAIKGKTTRVNTAVQDEKGQWSATSISYGNFKNGQEIGEIVANGVWTHKEDSNRKENYYIVKDCFFAGISCKYGVVLQHQVTDIKN